MGQNIGSSTRETWRTNEIKWWGEGTEKLLAGDSAASEEKKSREPRRQIQSFAPKINLAASSLALRLVFPVPLPASVPSTVFGELQR